MAHQNLLGEPPATYLPGNEEAAAAAAAGEAPEKVAARFPDYSAAWAALAARAFGQGDAVTAYAYARTGYHRGLDQLRRAGWHGGGPIPWEHGPNRGFLRSLYMLGTSAAAIGEDDEAARCEQLLRDSSATAAAELAAEAPGRPLDERFPILPASGRATAPLRRHAAWARLGYLPSLRVTSERKSPCRACA